ncbi:MAG: hypothetical protein ACYTG0_35870 [Planctomycetota bacterium]|jgi:hypothetical protein
MDIETHNRRQIDALNQRGGRTLSIVDLIRAGTVSIPMAAYALRAMEEGASLLTGARPGGAGKTTLMAALLSFLPPGVPIVTVDQSRVIAEGLDLPADRPCCFLAHEIGSGHWFGYIWGRDVADFLSLAEHQRRIASCLHADTLEELTEIVCSPPLGASPEALGRVGLVLFMHAGGRLGSLRRRVAAFWEADGAGRHRLLFRWQAESDAFEQVADLRDANALTPYVDHMERLVREGDADAQAVRRKVLAFYERNA